MSEQNDVLVEQSGYILKIRLNRPDRKNAINQAMYRTIQSALATADHDDSVRVVVFCGHPDAFSAGNDLMEFARPVHEDLAPVISFLRQLVTMEKPMIAAVEGLAIGVGVTMLLHCDLVYAAEGTRFRLPFVNLGVVPEAASSLIMPRLMGRQRASELLLLGDFFDSKKAQDYGVVNEILPKGDVLDHAMKKAGLLAQQPQKALMFTRKLINKKLQDAIEDRLSEEGMVFSRLLKSKETHQAVMKFLQQKQSEKAEMKQQQNEKSDVV